MGYLHLFGTLSHSVNLSTVLSILATHCTSSAVALSPSWDGDPSGTVTTCPRGPQRSFGGLWQGSGDGSCDPGRHDGRSNTVPSTALPVLGLKGGLEGGGFAPGREKVTTWITVKGQHGRPRNGGRNLSVAGWNQVQEVPVQSESEGHGVTVERDKRCALQVGPAMVRVGKSDGHGLPLYSPERGLVGL